MKVLQSTSSLLNLLIEILKRPSGKDEVDILGTLHSTIRGLWKYEAVVDKWPGFSAIVLRPLQLVPRQSKYQEVYVYGHIDSLKGLLLHKDTLPWNECMTFRACPIILKPALDEAARQHKGSILDIDRYYQRIVEKENYQPETLATALPEGFAITQILEKDAPFVQQCWNQFAVEHNHCSTTLETIRYLIQKSVTSCLYNSEGKPVSWVLLHHSGAVLSAYTVSEYRRQKMLKIVHRHLKDKVEEFGQLFLHSIAAVGNSKVQSQIQVIAQTIPGYVTYYHYIPNNFKSNI